MVYAAIVKIQSYSIAASQSCNTKTELLDCGIHVAGSNTTAGNGHTQISYPLHDCVKSSIWHKGEIRALGFFCEVVGPALSGELDSYFWTHLVTQLTHREDAVRHAMVCISMLYEQQQNSHTHTPLLGNSQALIHYNAAVRSLGLVRDESIVLLTCILFVCIEFFLGNTELATNHCRHGTLMFNAIGNSSAVARHRLGPIYRRMSIFPYFFGSTVSTFPPMIASGSCMSKAFFSLEDSQQYLDEILSLSTRFIRKADEYRLGKSMHLLIPSSLVGEQHEVQALLERWNAAFCNFVDKSRNFKTRSYYTLQIRYLVAKIWSDTALDRSEMAFDRHLRYFQSIKNMASQLMPAAHAKSGSYIRPSFTFEMGFLPLLYFMVIKCRDVELRLSALSLMHELAAEREGLWDLNTMAVVGRRVIEIEHDITLANMNAKSVPLANLDAPPEGRRIWESKLGPENSRLSERGCPIYEREATFFLRVPGEELSFVKEWLTILS